MVRLFGFLEKIAERNERRYQKVREKTQAYMNLVDEQIGIIQKYCIPLHEFEILMDIDKIDWNTTRYPISNYYKIPRDTPINKHERLAKKIEIGKKYKMSARDFGMLLEVSPDGLKKMLYRNDKYLTSLVKAG